MQLQSSALPSRSNSNLLFLLSEALNFERDKYFQEVIWPIDLVVPAVLELRINSESRLANLKLECHCGRINWTDYRWPHWLMILPSDWSTNLFGLSGALNLLSSVAQIYKVSLICHGAVFNNISNFWSWHLTDLAWECIHLHFGAKKYKMIQS